MVHAFPMSISQKVNVMDRLEFELAFFEASVQYVNPYATKTPPYEKWRSSWSQYNDQMVQEISHGKQEPWGSGMFRLAKSSE